MRRVEELPSDLAIDEALDIRAVGLDDYAHVRYIHATSFRLHAASILDPEALAAASEHFVSPDYNDELMRQELVAGWIDGEMVGTADWHPAGDAEGTARIASVYVRPLFTGLGVGRRLVGAAETRARVRGFSQFSARTMASSAGFFERLGYEVTSHGASAVGRLPLAYLRRREAHRDARQSRPRAAGGEPVHSVVELGAREPQRACVTSIMADAASAIEPPPLKFFRY